MRKIVFVSFLIFFIVFGLNTIYAQTAAYGHFGRTDCDLPWEKTDKAVILK